MSNPTHEEARWLIAHAKENDKVEWLAGWDSGRNYGKLCAEERIIKLVERFGFNEELGFSFEQAKQDLLTLIKGEK